MILPQQPKPTSNYESFIMHYNNKTSREVYVTDEEIPLPSSVIFSSTDLQGKIVKVNDAFVKASGWEESDLIGSPHCILRHPHMPRVAFYDMWNNLNEKGRWNGYVKNLCKGGGYYWVHAIVTSTRRDGKVVGYQSARHRINDEKKLNFEGLYAQIRAVDSIEEQIKIFATL